MTQVIGSTSWIKDCTTMVHGINEQSWIWHSGPLAARSNQENASTDHRSVLPWKTGPSWKTILCSLMLAQNRVIQCQTPTKINVGRGPNSVRQHIYGDLY